MHTVPTDEGKLQVASSASAAGSQQSLCRMSIYSVLFAVCFFFLLSPLHSPIQAHLATFPQTATCRQEVSAWEGVRTPSGASSHVLPGNSGTAQIRPKNRWVGRECLLPSGWLAPGANDPDGSGGTCRHGEKWFYDKQYSPFTPEQPIPGKIVPDVGKLLNLLGICSKVLSSSLGRGCEAAGFCGRCKFDEQVKKKTKFQPRSKKREHEYSELEKFLFTLWRRRHFE